MSGFRAEMLGILPFFSETVAELKKVLLNIFLKLHSSMRFCRKEHLMRMRKITEAKECPTLETAAKDFMDCLDKDTYIGIRMSRVESLCRRKRPGGR